MTGIFAGMLSFLLLYKYWALLAVFFISALFLPIPTSTVLLASGAFASQGYFNIWLSLFVVVAANIAGDCTGYLLAKIYGRRVLRALWVSTPSSIERLEASLRNHPGLAIFLTRFTGATDSLVNLLSGFAGVPLRTFLIYDALGNLASDGILLFAGYFFGAHWQDFVGFFNVGGYVLLGAAIITGILVMLWRRNRPVL